MTEAESDRLSAENTALRQLVQEQAHLIERLQQRIEEVEGRFSKKVSNFQARTLFEEGAVK